MSTVDDLHTLYRQTLPARIDALEAARSAGSTTELRSIAHSLRGSGATYGFPQVTHAAAAVEEATDEDLQGCVDDLIVVLRDVAAGGAPRGPTPRLRVLLVDDDPEIRLLVTHLLRSARYDVAEAGSSREATAALAVGQVDVVLMDVMLGTEDGVEAAAALFRAMPGPVPRLIFLTGSVRAEEFERMNAAAPAGIIHKPFDPDSFVSLFERLVGIGV